MSSPPSLAPDPGALATLARLASRHGDAVREQARQDAEELSDAYVALRALVAALQQDPEGLSPEDVSDGLAQIAVASAAIEEFEYVLMRYSRTPIPGCKDPRLTWRQVASAMRLESEQAAMQRYKRRVKRYADEPR